ncbi:MAG TPA: ATP-binding cassette domain-containing protein [Jiangellales bacterium]|nr:ATP-binding cassette domain-containing protein [Jiangellales bacterium]
MSESIIEVDEVVKRFGGETPALDRLSLSVPAGIVYGLLGPNGAGKTTLIRILATLLPADSGLARVAGFDVRRYPAAVRERIGLAGQHAAVDGHLTGRENVEMIGRLYGLSRRDAKTRAAAVVERIGLGAAADRQVRTYSGGKRRRIDLAASLVGAPRVLFLDEPTTGVDPASRRALWDLIGDLVDGGTTVVLTTQYLEEADQLATRIGVIDHGRLLSEGTPDQLKRHTGPAVLQLSIPDTERARAVEALRRVGAQPPAEDQARGVLVLPAVDGIATLRAALQVLDDAAITPTDVGLHRPTLDDVFLALTASNDSNRRIAA